MINLIKIIRVYHQIQLIKTNNNKYKQAHCLNLFHIIEKLLKNEILQKVIKETLFKNNTRFLRTKYQNL